MKSKLLSWPVIGILAVAALGLGAWLRLQLTAAGENQPVRPPIPISVRTALASRGTVQSWVFAEGTARSVRREYLTFENAGRVTFVKDGEDGQDLREGSSVAAGDLLARQDQRSLQADVDSTRAALDEARTQVTVAEAEESRARTDLELAEKTRERFAVLLEQASASKQEFDEAEAKAALTAAAVTQATSRLAAALAKVTTAEARLRQSLLTLEETEIHAPIDGVLAYVNIKEGFYFTPNLVRSDDESAALQTVPMVVIDPTAFEITVNVPSFVGDAIGPGQRAIVAVRPEAVTQLASGIPDEASDAIVRGTVFSVTPSVSPGGRSIQIKVRVTDDAHRLKDGLFVSVWLASVKQSDTVIVPVQAILFEDNQPHVFVVDSGIVERRPIGIGLQEFTRQQVTAGLDAGERVVTDGRFQVSHGARVRLIADEAAAGGDK